MPSDRSDATPAAELTPSVLRSCIPAPPLVLRPGCAVRGDAGAGPVVCGDFAPAESSDVDVLSILVAPAPFDFAQVLGIPSMQTILDGGASGLDAMREVYRNFEGPRFEPTGDGRRVALEARGLMLGGVVHWGTLPSPRATFDTVVVRALPLHDSPLTDDDRKAVEGWDLAKIVQCLDAILWPKTP